MENRLGLQQELLAFSPNVYFQAPSDIRMIYPCIVFNKVSNKILHADDTTYKKTQEYQLTVMDFDPDSTIADDIVAYFKYSTIGSYFVVDRLHHTTINIYY